MNEIYKPYRSINVSGGKDSLFMFKLICDKGLPFDCVRAVTLEIENPIETKVKKYIKEECSKFNIPFVEIKPDRTYQSLYDSYSLPNPNKPWLWCQKLYKQKALQKMDYDLYKRGFKAYSYVGYCVDEYYRYNNGKAEKYNYLLPLVDYNISESFILEWARTVELFDGWYDSFNRLGCTMCPYAKEAEIKWLLKKGYKPYTLSNGVNRNYYGKEKIISL